MHLVAWPMNASEAGSDLALLRTSAPNNLIYTAKAVRSVSQQGHLRPHFQFKGQVTEQTALKWSLSKL